MASGHWSFCAAVKPEDKEATTLGGLQKGAGRGAVGGSKV